MSLFSFAGTLEFDAEFAWPSLWESKDPDDEVDILSAKVESSAFIWKGSIQSCITPSPLEAKYVQLSRIMVILVGLKKHAG